MRAEFIHVDHQGGVTLIELVFFIVIVSIAAIVLLGAYARVLPQEPTATQITQATQLAQERMELIFAQKAVLGFSSTALDPCTPGPGPAICTPIAGFTVSSGATATSLAAWPVDTDTTKYRLITVTVNGPAGNQLAQLTAVMANY